MASPFACEARREGGKMVVFPIRLFLVLFGISTTIFVIFEFNPAGLKAGNGGLGV